MTDRCEACGKEFASGEGCAFDQLQFGNGRIVERLRYVDDMPCPGCGVQAGNVHHFQCPQEVCPACEAKLVGCGCL